jgi:hypothetical protein
MLSFSSYPDEQIPVLTLNGTLELEAAEHVTVSKYLLVQTTKDGNSTTIPTEDICSLEPGTYYIRVFSVLWGDIVQEKQEYTEYYFGFKLIIPATPIA